MNSAIDKLVTELRTDLVPAKAAPALSAGFTSGFSLLVAQVAFGSFIFSGSLAGWSSQGVGLVLFGNFAACLVIALAGGYRGAISGLSPALVIVMAMVASTMDAGGDARFVTTACALILGAVATGVLCLLIGRYRLANLLRFIPYPVTAGFVAGIGGAVCLAAMSQMGAELDWRTTPGLFEPATFWRWAPGAAYGIALYLAMKRWSNALLLPVSVAVAVGAYHLVLAALDISGDEARAAGILFTSTVEGNIWPALGPAEFAHVDWGAMAKQIPNLLTLILVALICVVMNVAGVELATNEELDWDREFRATGAASVISGLGGGTVATMVVPASLRSKLFGAAFRMTGIIAALVIGGALFLGDALLELVPVPLVGGAMLIFAGLSMLDEGLVRSRRRLPWTEYAIILLIFVVIVSLGLIQGVGAGMLATLVFFAVRLSRVDPIESRFTARERRSNKARPVPERAILLEEGERVHVYRLRGYIFFGSAFPLADELKKSLSRTTRPTCLTLDFAAVSGFDYSAVHVLGRLVRTFDAAGVRVVLSAMSGSLRIAMERNLPPAAFSRLRFESDLDLALERGEDLVIATWKADEDASNERRSVLLEHAADDLERHLERQIHFEELAEELDPWTTTTECAPGDPLTGPGTPGDGLQLLIAGRASAYDSAGVRLHQFGPGDAIWPAGSSGDETTSVIADESCRTMVLAEPARRWLERHEERTALDLYRYLLAGHFRTGPSPGRSGEGESDRQ